ncbi:MAG: MerR family transcriptional regulator [Peptostreptococcaceae bacterium]
MKKYFSIGEMSKLQNISIETLRHYDRLGLLNAEYINEKTGYRYYSTKSFIKIYLIKQCKAIGLSLEEIKDIMDDYTSLESVLDIVKNQKEIINKKIIELNNIKSSIESLQSSIEEALDVGLNEIFIKYNKQRKLKKFNYTGRYTEEFEMNLRKSILEVEQEYNGINLDIAFETSYEDLMVNDEILYTKTMMELPDYKINNSDDNIVTLKEGNYLTYYFDDNFYDNKKYYDEVISYIKDNKINVVGEFYEIHKMTRVSKDGQEKSLAKIEILINN